MCPAAEEGGVNSVSRHFSSGTACTTGQTLVRAGLDARKSRGAGLHACVRPRRRPRQVYRWPTASGQMAGASVLQIPVITLRGSFWKEKAKICHHGGGYVSAVALAKREMHSSGVGRDCTSKGWMHFQFARGGPQLCGSEVLAEVGPHIPGFALTVTGQMHHRLFPRLVSLAPLVERPEMSVGDEREWLPESLRGLDIGRRVSVPGRLSRPSSKAARHLPNQPWGMARIPRRGGLCPPSVVQWKPRQPRANPLCGDAARELASRSRTL